MASDQTPQPNPSPRRHIELSSVQVLASVAAAVSAAIAASALGVAGTIAGTAVVSVVATVGNAFYSATFKRGKETLVQAHQLIIARPVDTRLAATPPAAAESETVSLAAPTVLVRDAARGDIDTAHLIVPTRVETTEPTATESTETESTEAEPTEAGAAEAGAVEAEAIRPVVVEPGRTLHATGGYEQHRLRLTPKRVGVLAGSAVLVFVAAFGVLTGIESAMGTSFPALFGHGDSGSTAGALLHHDTTPERGGDNDPGRSGTAGSPTPSASPSPAGTPTPTPSETPLRATGSTPTGSPSPTPRTSSPAPTTSPASPVPSSTPTR